MRRTWTSRQQLEEIGLSLEVNEKGEYEFYQNKKGRKKRLKIQNITVKHKYGKDITYPGLTIYFGEKTVRNGRYYYKQTSLLTHVFVWLWFNNTLSNDVDVDHIDENKFNYKLDNLQLLTRADNLLKRGIGRNQYSWNLTEEEIIDKRRLKEKEVYERQYRKCLRATKNFYKAMYKNTITKIRDDMREITSKLDSCTHQEYLSYLGKLKSLRQMKKDAKERLDNKLKERGNK